MLYKKINSDSEIKVDFRKEWCHTKKSQMLQEIAMPL